MVIGWLITTIIKGSMVFEIMLLVLGALCLVGAMVCLFWSRVAAALPAYAGLVLLHVSTYIYLPVKTFVFWGVATLLVVGIQRLLPPGEPNGGKAGKVYVGISALAGCLLGMVVGARAMVLGVVLGSFVGQMAYSRTPEGGWLKFPTSTFIQYFCARSLPVVVAVSMLGIAIEGFIF